MYRYYGEGSGNSGGYCVSFSFSAIPSSYELIAYGARDRKTQYLENDRYAIGDRAGEQPGVGVSRWARQRGVDLTISMEKMRRPSLPNRARTRMGGVPNFPGACFRNGTMWGEIRHEYYAV